MSKNDTFIFLLELYFGFLQTFDNSIESLKFWKNPKYNSKLSIHVSFLIMLINKKFDIFHKKIKNEIYVLGIVTALSH